MTTNNGAGGLVAKWREESKLLEKSFDPSNTIIAVERRWCARELEAALQVPLSGLPELPEAVRVTVDWFDEDRVVNNLYTADQMRAYAKAALQAPGEAVAWEGRWPLPLPDGTRSNWTRIPKEEYDRRLRDACNPYELRALYTTPPSDVLRRVVEALSELGDACFAEYCSDATETGEMREEDDDKVSYPEDRCHITFGMIRRVREALAAHKALAEGVTK